MLLPPLAVVGLLSLVLLASGNRGNKQFAGLLGIQGVAQHLAELDAAGRGARSPVVLPPAPALTAAVEALRHCATFECLRSVHSMASAAAARFSFPHFM